jgi:hypothetical protein
MIGLMPKVFIFALCISFIFANPVIKKNDIVDVVYDKPYLKISSKARATTDGNVGDHMVFETIPKHKGETPRQIIAVVISVKKAKISND